MGTLVQTSFRSEEDTARDGIQWGTGEGLQSDILIVPAGGEDAGNCEARRRRLAEAPRREVLLRRQQRRRRCQRRRFGHRDARQQQLVVPTRSEAFASCVKNFFASPQITFVLITLNLQILRHEPSEPPLSSTESDHSLAILRS